MFCGIKLNRFNFSIFSIYRTAQCDMSCEEYVNFLTRLPTSYIICGDFNAHHITFGSARTNNAGNILLKAIDITESIFLNDGSPTRMANPNQGASAVDITLCSQELAQRTQWRVLDDSYTSDHLPILITITYTGDNISTIYPTQRWKIDKTKVTSYTDYICKTQPITPKLPSANEKVEFCLQCIRQAADSVFSLKKPFIPNNKTPPWWDEECSEVIKKRKQALRNFNANRTLENYLEHRKVSAYSKRFLKYKKRKSWNAFCSSLNKDTPISQVWRKIRNFKQPSIRTATLPDNHLYTFLNNLTPDFVVTEKPIICSKPDDKHFILEPFSMIELNRVLNDVNDSAPGMDDIRYILLTNLPNNHKENLLAAYNGMWLNNEEVDVLKNVLVVPILKPNKEPSAVNSYRPIALMSCIIKVYERMIKNRLDWWLDTGNILPTQQFGFRKRRGTIDALTGLISDIEIAFTRNETIGSIFLDIAGAYNGVDLDILEYKLNSIGLPHQASRRITDLYRNIKLFVRSGKNDRVGPRSISHGLLQGSTLSPVLFNIYTLDLHSTFGPKVNVIQYADDFCIYISGKNIKQLSSELSKTVLTIKNWLFRNALDLSPQKTNVMFFSRSRKIPTDNIKLANYSFTIPQHIKYLGLTFDNKLKWGFHINAVVTKCEKALNILRIITKVRWGSDFSTAMSVYKAYIRSVIDYGCSLYGNASPKHLHRLDVIQNKALRIAVGAMRSTPVNALQIEANEPPLSLRRQMLAVKYITKAKMVKMTTILSNLSTLSIMDLTAAYWQKKKSPLLCDAFRYSANLDTRFYKAEEKSITFFESIRPCFITFPPYIGQKEHDCQLYKHISLQFQRDLVVFTDGSKCDAGCGGAFYVVNNGLYKLFKLDPDASIFTVEAVAILEALRYGSVSNYKRIDIMSDSASVLQSLSQYPSTKDNISCIVKDIFNLVTELHRGGVSVAFFWVKGHSGIPFNETVDRLAKLSCTEGSPYKASLSEKDILNIVNRNLLYQNWDNLWKEAYNERMTQYAFIHPSVFSRPWYYSCGKMSRFYRTTIARIKFGHGQYPSHLHRLRIIESPRCRCGYEVCDLNHILFNCPLHKDAINLFINQLIGKGVVLPTSIITLMCQNNKHICDLIINILKKINVRI